MDLQPIDFIRGSYIRTSQSGTVDFSIETQEQESEYRAFIDSSEYNFPPKDFELWKVKTNLAFIS
jgi:hypothetical protein